MLQLVFTSQIVPKKNSKIPRVSRYGKPYLQPNPRAEVSESDLKWEAMAQREGFKVLSSPVKVRIEAWKFPRMRSDLVGIVETIQDALNGVAYTDDRLIHELEAVWVKNTKTHPRFHDNRKISAIVTIEKL